MLLPIYDRLSKRLSRLRFGPPVAFVYNPLEYARASHSQYLERHGRTKGRVLFLGMNPGPFGMAQTGIPFGEVSAVRDWLQIDAPIGRPAQEHPKRPVEGLACKRAEVSGQRLWGLFRDRFGTPERFFAEAFVANYCPLAFVEESGANRTPDKLPALEREPLMAACDAALAEVVAALSPRLVVGVGDFARKRAEAVMAADSRLADINIGQVLHPSPASPRANRGWAEAALTELGAMGLHW
jgi:single-strand selective monofunctional uracil DNA glycosylase